MTATTSLGKICWRGASGANYDFHVYELTREFPTGGAVFIFSEAQFSAAHGGTHSLVYIGQTEDLSAPLDDSMKDCIVREGANCICIHSEENAKKRRAIEADLLGRWATPCNTPA